jgi:hypothetical protein
MLQIPSGTHRSHRRLTRSVWILTGIPTRPRPRPGFRPAAGALPTRRRIILVCGWLVYPI